MSLHSPERQADEPHTDAGNAAYKARRKASALAARLIERPLPFGPFKQHYNALKNRRRKMKALMGARALRRLRRQPTTGA
jgi:hypothetical protein